MKAANYYQVLLLLLLCFAVSGCGAISNDGFNEYYNEFKFGDVKAKLFGEQNGVFFIKRSAPYELLLSVSLNDGNITELNVKNLQLINIENNKVIFINKNIPLNLKPKPNESQIYYVEKDILKQFVEVKLNFTLEVKYHDKTENHEIWFLFEKRPTSRFWYFWELV